MLRSALAIAVFSVVARGQAYLGPDFLADYSFYDVGTPAIPGSITGITFESGNTNALLIGGYGYSSFGTIWQVPIVRDAGGHVASYAGGNVQVATAPYIDGGLTYGPGGVLFHTGWGPNTLGQLEAGSTAPDRTDVLTGYGVGGSVGGVTFVPPGFAGAGKCKLTDFNTEGWYELPLTPDGNGTYQPGTAVLLATITGWGGPEAIAYVAGGVPGFAVDSVVIAEYGAWQAAVYDIDGNGDPIIATRRVLIDNVPNLDGLTIDPLTGDFLITTAGGGDRLIVVRRNGPVITPYCTSGTTTSGCNATIAGTGTPSGSSGSGFTISVSGVEGAKQGLLFYGISGRIVSPWGLGSSFLCVKAPTQRMPVQNSGGTVGQCNGVLSIDWNTYVAGTAGALGTPFVGGEVVNAQSWFRDPPSPKTTNLSNGLEFSVTP
jgi:hypothetical protein